MNPPKIHLTVPKAFQVRRAIPGHLAIHHADLSDSDVTSVEAIPATTVRRAIEDCHRTHLGPALLRQAIEDGEREGYLGSDDARELQRLILP